MDEDRLTEVRSVLSRHGLQCRHIEVLSRRVSGRKSGRTTLRAILTDGSSVKVRCLETSETASQLVDLRSRVSRAFVPIIAREDAILLEPWIEGDELSLAEATERAEDIGAILGQLHATDILGTPRTIRTAERSDRALKQLKELAESGVLSTSLSASLQADVVRTDPGESLQTIVHRDYCPENIVVDSRGDLHVVDNEWIAIEAPGVDLGRTFSRWPMSDEIWQRFLKGYATTAPFDPGPLRFWMIVMAVAGATVRLQGPPEDLAVPVRRLRDLATVSQT